MFWVCFFLDSVYFLFSTALLGLNIDPQHVKIPIVPDRIIRNNHQVQGVLDQLPGAIVKSPSPHLDVTLTAILAALIKGLAGDVKLRSQKGSPSVSYVMPELQKKEELGTSRWKLWSEEWFRNP